MESSEEDRLRHVEIALGRVEAVLGVAHARTSERLSVLEDRLWKVGLGAAGLGALAGVIGPKIIDAINGG